MGSLSMSFALKTLGAILVTGAGGWAGFFGAKTLENRIDELHRLEAALGFLGSEISHSLSPLPIVLTRAGERAGGTIGEILCCTGDLTGLLERRTPADALSLSLEDKKIDGFQAGLLKDLVRDLGVFGHKEQVSLIRMSQDRVRSHRRQMEDEYRKRARVYRYLGLFAGASVAIVLM